MRARLLAPQYVNPTEHCKSENEKEWWKTNIFKGEERIVQLSVTVESFTTAESWVNYFGNFSHAHGFIPIREKKTFLVVFFLSLLNE